MANKLTKKNYSEETFYCISIKIHSDQENKQDLYSDIFRRIYNLENFNARIGGKNGLSLKKLDEFKLSKKQLGNEFDSVPFDELKILRGELVKYKIEDEDDKYFNTISKELKSGDPSSPDKPNAFTINIYLIPSIHRILLPIKSKLTPEQLKLYFEQALYKIYESEDYFNVDIAKSEEEVNKIYKLKKLNKLILEISYTNDDLAQDEKLFMDSLLKEADVNKYKGEFRSENSDSLNMNSKIIKGGIELSKENGELIATGINDFGNKETINTKNKFEEVKFKIIKDLDPLVSLLKETYKKWRI